MTIFTEKINFERIETEIVWLYECIGAYIVPILTDDDGR